MYYKGIVESLVDIVIFFQLIASHSSQSNSKTLMEMEKIDRIVEQDSDPLSHHL